MFNFFKSNPANGAAAQPLNGHAPAAPPLPEVEERVFIEPASAQAAPPQGHFTEQQPAPADHTINVLYAFLDRNHEAKGYDDALLNPDSNHLQQNLGALKSELVRTISRVKTFYGDFIRETDYHILSRSRSAMVDMVEELEMKKHIALGHLEKIHEIEHGIDDEHGDCQGILISYTRGFRNGLAAISHHQILTRKL